VANAARAERHQNELQALVTSVESDFNAPLTAALARRFSKSRAGDGQVLHQQIDLSSMNRNDRPRCERAFAGITNIGFLEHPEFPSANDNDFRLWSQEIAVVRCLGNKITAWSTSRLAHRGGTEMWVGSKATRAPESLRSRSTPRGDRDVTSVVISYAIKGRPDVKSECLSNWYAIVRVTTSGIECALR